VNESEARALRDENERLRRELADLRARVDSHSEQPRRASRATADLGASTPASSQPAAVDASALYEELKRRLLAEPAVLRVLAEKPELRVETVRVTIDAKGDSLRGRIAQLLAGGFYDRGATAPGTQKELARRGSDPGPSNTYKELDALAVLGFLTIEQGRDDRSRPRKEYHAVPGMKVNIVERG
jgi:hypothetical protein